MRTKNNGLLKFAIKGTISIDNSDVCAERMKKIRNPLKREPFAQCPYGAKGHWAKGSLFKGFSLQRVISSKGSLFKGLP